MRSKIKYISNKPEKFIPTTHRMDPSLDESAPDVKDRPMYFMIRKLTRDEQFKVRELLELKDEADPSRGIKGSGDIAKFIWENCIVSAHNVLVDEGDEIAVGHDVMTGKDKNDLWNTEGMDFEMHEAILFARSNSSHSEVEAKN
jgi:hypothetical protein